MGDATSSKAVKSSPRAKSVWIGLLLTIFVVDGCGRSVGDPGAVIADGGGRLRIRIADPEVSGDTVYFERNIEEVGDPSGIWSYDLKTGELLYVVDGSSPAANRSGTALAYRGASGIGVIELETGNARTVATCACYDPEWLADESEIAFTEATYADSGGVWVLELDDGTLRRVGPRGAREASVSADGRRLVYRGPGGAGDSYDIVLVDLLTGDRRVVASGRYAKPHWSPDGRRLLLGSLHGVYLVDVDGGTPTLLAESLEPAGDLNNWYAGDWINEAEIVFNRVGLWYMNLESREVRRLLSGE